MNDTVTCEACGTRVPRRDSAKFVESLVKEPGESWENVFYAVNKGSTFYGSAVVTVVQKQSEPASFDAYSRDQAEEIFVVFECEGVFWKLTGTSSSYEGNVFYSGLRRVTPKTVEVVTYE